MNRHHQPVHVQATVGAHGSVIIEQLPFALGQRVKITISPIAASRCRRYVTVSAQWNEGGV
jgi:hypothetical protein